MNTLAQVVLIIALAWTSYATFGYLMRGTLEVKTGNGDTTIIREGRAAIEVMHTLHRGKAIGGPVEILVFYAGAVNQENTLAMGETGCG